MACSVRFSENAVKDIEDIYAYIARQDGVKKADYVISQITERIATLTTLPERGVYPKELAALGVHDYREVFFKPYRIIYRLKGRTVYILLVADGRRDMQTLLQRRMLQ